MKLKILREVVSKGKSGFYEDKDGKPVTFYRGTRRKNNLATKLGLLSFTTDRDVAKIYSATPKRVKFGSELDADLGPEATVGEYHLKMTNPVVVEDVKMTILDFIDDHMGGLKEIGEENLLRLLKYLANRESGKIPGSRFEHEFDYYADEYIEPEMTFGGTVSIGPTFLSLYTTIRDNYEDRDRVENALGSVTVDTFVMIDSPVFVNVSKAAGYDGVVHADAFDAGPMVGKKIIGKDVSDTHLTYRPFDKSQVVAAKSA